MISTRCSNDRTAIPHGLHRHIFPCHRRIVDLGGKPACRRGGAVISNSSRNIAHLPRKAFHPFLGVGQRSRMQQVIRNRDVIPAQFIRGRRWAMPVDASMPGERQYVCVCPLRRHGSHHATEKFPNVRKVQFISQRISNFRNFIPKTGKTGGRLASR